jgi:prepilin-type N-terminal cleavage/methylation domain-containing protein/prepilin-type processing-associated H-X9-DG protein
MSRINRRRSGFTIIEIVVALAVGAMVVTLLMPAIFQSRENSKQYVCMQHLHQVGVQGQVFVQSMPKGNFPALNMSLAPNEDGTISVAVARRDDYSGGWSYFKNTSFVCPTDLNAGIMQVRNTDDTYRTLPVSYGYSIRMLYNGIAWTDKQMGPPSDVTVFFDGYMNGPDSATGKNIEGNYLSTMDFALYSLQFRHRNKVAQASFADGHVKTFSYFDQSYYPTFGSGNRPASEVAAAPIVSAPVPAAGNANGGPHNNNGHGNNIDGVDVSNPGKGKGGPGGGVDPSGTIDDEKQGKPV